MMWLASPALPVGAFSYSEGLESAVEAKWVHDEGSAAQWLSDQAGVVLARGEWPAMVHAMAAWHRHDEPAVRTIDAWVWATRETAEQRAQAQQMGTSLMQWLRNSAHRDDPRLGSPVHRSVWSWPVAYALAATLAKIEARDALVAASFGWAENMVQAAMKAVPLGQAAAQRILERLVVELPDAVERAMAVREDERRSFAPMLAILGSRHETQYTRIFRS